MKNILIIVLCAAVAWLSWAVTRKPTVSESIKTCEQYLRVATPGYGVSIDSSGTITIQPF